MYKHLLLFSIVLFLSACGGKKAEPEQIVEIEPAEPEYPITVPFEAGVAVEREMKLSDIADSVRYILLETN
ncbi:hypothetical protein [uncultured Parabacteroides sp.]|uniref:hypothetical protein n=1 Tax=uncultured Parabacteroides sp. TaxID=512312 RepID=UPI0026DD3219|nr:hypothetical protein [uncultured Parabacteroides sp.]